MSRQTIFKVDLNDETLNYEIDFKGSEVQMYEALGTLFVSILNQSKTPKRSVEILKSIADDAWLYHNSQVGGGQDGGKSE